MNLADLEILNYTGEMGKIWWPAGFAQVLEGKTIAQQLECYRVADWDVGPRSYYLNELCMHRRGFLPFRNDLAGLIVQEDKIVGVRIRLSENEDGPTADLYPYEVQVCEYIRSYTTSRDPRNRQLIGMPLPG